MLSIIGRIFFCVVEIFYITYALEIVRNRKFDISDYIFCIFLYIPSIFILKDNNSREYIIKNIYIVFIFVMYLLKNNMVLSKYIPIVCMFLCILEIVRIIIGMLSGIIAVIISSETLTIQIVGPIVSFVLMIACGNILSSILKKRISVVNFSFSKKCIACFSYILVVCIKIPFLYTSIQEAKVLKMMIVTIICCTVIFFIISRIERRNAEMERAKIEENNKTLSTKLHKSQEIIPAVVQVLSNVTENSGKEMEEQETQKLLSEMTDLFGQQLKENSKEDLQLKNFCSTGLKVLDQQLKGYQIEAVNRGINLDIYVQAPINDIMKKDSIDQMKLQRALGDMIRNAFRATEIKRENEKCHANGHILLIIGCQYKDILEIAVVDNGTEIPLHVIEMFGKRGVTTGGTGNGLADLVEFTDETKASIRVEEFAWETSSFTKKISIIFDNQRENCFISARAELINSSFWKKESNY